MAEPDSVRAPERQVGIDDATLSKARATADLVERSPPGIEEQRRQVGCEIGLGDAHPAVKAACLADIDPEQQHGDLSIAAGSIYSGIILGAAAE